MELVEKNILPVESSLKEAIIGEATPATLCGLAGPIQREGALSFLLFGFLLRLGGRRYRMQEPDKQVVLAWDSASGHRDQRHPCQKE